MGSEFWTSLSGLLVSASGMYYAVLVFLRKAPSNPISWTAFSIIGLAIFLTSDSSFGLNAITFGFLNPTAITAVGIWRQFAQAKTPSRQELAGGTLGLVAIGAWLIAEEYGAPSGWTLGLSLLADCIPVWLIIQSTWKNPQDDRPFPWALYAFGYGIGSFGLHEFSVFTLTVPIYMFIGANAVALPLALYRIRHRMPIREWL